jgi:hypothetical protein
VLEENAISHILREEKTVSGFKASEGYFPYLSLWWQCRRCQVKNSLGVSVRESKGTEEVHQGPLHCGLAISQESMDDRILVLGFSHILFLPSLRHIVMNKISKTQSFLFWTMC